MLKNNDLISKLNIKQKIALLTGSHEVQDEIKDIVSLPFLNMCELWGEKSEEHGEELFPSLASLANSWDAQLVGQSALGIASMETQNGANFFVLPRANAASSVYGSEISEDPYLNGTLLSGAARALEGAGARVCLSSPAIMASEAEPLDLEADTAAIYERVARPFIMAKNAINGNVIHLTKSDATGSYADVNKKMLDSQVNQSTVVISSLQDGNNTVSEVNKGFQVIGGSNIALEAAYENYNRIYHSMQEGGATAYELEMAILDGAAISEEMIDIALDERLSLIKECNVSGLTMSNEDISQLALDATRKSIVLVKNEQNALPLKKGARVALIGDIILESENSAYTDFVNRITTALYQDGIGVTGFSQGYRLDEDVSTELIPSAIELAKASDTVLLFLGNGKQREKMLPETKRLSLPANQVALAMALSRLGKRVIAIVCGTRLPSMSFDERISSVLLVPPQGAYVANATAEVLSARYNPSGRLAYAGYNNMDANYREVQKRKRKGQQKIGQFVGYRYTDICNKVAKYPFGHGLSYTTFNYSGLQINGKSLSFSVQNAGNVSATETVQIYIGIKGSARIRPIKELKATSKISLSAYQKKTVTVNLADFEMFDSVSEKFVTETGNYSIYICTSASDIKLVQSTYVYGVSLASHGRPLAEYVQKQSNIRQESYTMEANCKPMNNISKLKTFGIWLLTLTIFSDVVYGICGLMFGIPFKEHMATFFALNAVSIVISVICLIVYASAHQRVIEKQKVKERKATKELFKAAEYVDVSSIEKLFVEEFDDESKKEKAKKAVTYKGEEESIYVYMAVDTDFQTLASDLEHFCAASGLAISPACAKSVVASMMSSRLLVLNHEQKDIVKGFVQLLGAFFGTRACIESYEGRATELSTLLYTRDSYGNPVETAMVGAFNDANEDGTKPSFFAMSELDLTSTEALFMPYVQFLGNPRESYTVEENGVKHKLPSNMWFVIIPREGQAYDEMPAFVSNLASVIELDAQPCENDLTERIYKPVTCHQLEALVYRAKKAVSIDEEVWKAVDALEEFVNERTPYHIGNKIFLQLECYMSVYLKCGAEQNEAVDGAVSSKLLSAISAILKGNPAMADVDFIQTLESIFGEDSVARCTSVVRNTSVCQAQSVLSAQELKDSKGDVNNVR